MLPRAKSACNQRELISRDQALFNFPTTVQGCDSGFRNLMRWFDSTRWYQHNLSVCSNGYEPELSIPECRVRFPLRTPTSE